MKKFLSKLVSSGKKTIGRLLNSPKHNFIRKMGRNLVQKAIDSATTYAKKKIPGVGGYIDANKGSLKKMALGKYNQLYNNVAKQLSNGKTGNSTGNSTGNVTDSYDQKEPQPQQYGTGALYE